MDSLAPVAAEINPPAPISGVGMLSNLIGIKQQQQNLQTGVYKQQTEQAQAQQQQLAASQQQGVQSFFSSWDPSQHIADDGTTDLDSALQSSQFQSAGNAKPAIMQALLDIKNKQLVNKTQLASLNGTVLDQLATNVGAIAKDPDVVEDKTDPATGVNAGRAKVDAYFNQFAKQGPDAARIAGIYQPMVDHAPQGQLGTAVGALQMQALSAAEQLPKPMAVGAGASTKIYNVAPGGMAPGQQPVTSTPYVTPPTNVTNAAGQLTHVAAGGAGLPAAGANNPTSPQVAFNAGQATATAGRAAQGIEYANQSPAALDALSRARAILDQGTLTGGTFTAFTKFKNLLAGIGVDTSGATNANELVKNLARYEGTRASGIGNTDAARSLFETGAPNTHVDAQAAKNIVTQSMANEMAIQGYAKSVGSAANPQDAIQREQQFRSTPNLVEGYEYSLMRSPAEAEQFLKRYNLTPQQLQQTRAQMKAQGLL